MFDFVIGNDDFGKNLAKALNCEYREFKEEYYPDGEPCPRIMAEYEEIKGKRVILSPRITQKSTKEKVALYLHNSERILGALTSEELYNADYVDVLFPYFWLGRQDHNPKTDNSEELRIRDRGKDIGYKTILRTFRGLGARRIITVDPHFFRQEGSTMICDMEIVSISGIYALGRYLKNRVNDNTVILSPDLRGGVLSDKLADQLGLKSESLAKKRISESKAESKEIYNANGANVVIMDDIISTAGTLKNVIDNLYNACSVTVACVHAILPEIGYNRLIELKRAGKINDIIATDTINSDFTKTSIVPEIVKALQI